MHEKMNDEIREFVGKLDLPVIFSSVHPQADQQFISVIIDDYNAACDATRYLIGLGHERIAFIGGDMRDVTSGQNRYLGYRTALEETGIAINDDYIRFGDYKPQSGYDRMRSCSSAARAQRQISVSSDDISSRCDELHS